MCAKKRAAKGSAFMCMCMCMCPCMCVSESGAGFAVSFVNKQRQRDFKNNSLGMQFKYIEYVYLTPLFP